MTNPLPFVLAVVAAFFFACAAVLQHRAVTAEPVPLPGSRALRGLRDVTRSPLWRLGLLLAAGGSTLHAIALVFAPLSVLQPVGVLAVPIAVILAAAHTHRKPTAGMLVGVLLSATCVVTFVTTAAGSAVSTPATGCDTALAGLVVSLVLLMLAGVGLACTGWVRCVACAMAGATAFGLVSALVRTVSQTITSGRVSILDPTVATGVAAVAVAILTGGWLVQQAFASGPPEVVVSCLTVVDPFVAVLFGVILLGEGNALSPTQWVVLITAAIGAIVGVAVLARHHPEATARSALEIRADPIRVQQVSPSHHR
ncbi:DMT family transporter [Mycobacterium sp. Aquia_216]|uniref:DMT family transporter n=1 Tax=Mycobacterium sp. Aquia_216 TaxID=2991729 RepID=UPI00227B75A2|nr:DMT family transporter [Mycobacterium sp. Aquia_216]WAJ47154.1 DMT family transporter [Mycobacterium sp. Aquia_216]